MFLCLFVMMFIYNTRKKRVQSVRNLIPVPLGDHSVLDNYLHNISLKY